MDKEVKALATSVAEDYLTRVTAGDSSEYLISDAKTLLELVERADARESADDIKKKELELESKRLDTETAKESKKSKLGLISAIIGGTASVVAAGAGIATAIIKAKSDSKHDDIVTARVEDLILAEKDGASFIGFSGKVTSGSIKD